MKKIIVGLSATLVLVALAAVILGVILAQKNGELAQTRTELVRAREQEFARYLISDSFSQKEFPPGSTAWQLQQMARLHDPIKIFKIEIDGVWYWAVKVNPSPPWGEVVPLRRVE